MVGMLVMILQAGSALAAPPLPPPSTQIWTKANFGRPTPTDYYPPDAKEAGAEGKVTVGLTIDTKGRASECWVIESSNWHSLDVATCRSAIWRFRSVPVKDAQGNPVTYRRYLTWNWKL